MVRKKLEEMNLIDDYLMSCVAGDSIVGEACCRRILSVLLQKDIAHVRVISQRVIPGNDTDLRGIRMDVEVEERIRGDEMENVACIYDIEPHTRNNMDFPHRNRFYQAKIDSKRLDSGETDFLKLPDLYVIMIMNFDPFKCDRMIYTFRNHCEEVPEIEYKDGLRFIYFNTKGTVGGSQDIKNMLDYIQGSVVTDDATKEVDGYVESVRERPGVREGIMTFGEHLDIEREEGREEGRQELLIRQICRKLRKNKTIPMIADELEEEESRINEICDLIKDCAPDYDEDAAIKLIQQMITV